MDLVESNSTQKHTFLNHVFSTTEDGKAEILNSVQYILLAVIPIIILNKTIQRFVPETDPDKSSLELTVELLLQLIVIIIGIVLIHRIITYIPTYSGFKYEQLSLSGSVLTFLIIVLSIQTKLGIKVNILVDRLGELWNGPSNESKQKQGVRVRQPTTRHIPSQADYVDNSQTQNDIFPPAPSSSIKTDGFQNQQQQGFLESIMPANSVLGGSFGSSF
jgi:glucan phosphoethanolaminetransferase (alkaline phosphatase superfamily)